MNFIEEVKKLGVDLTEDQLNKFEIYYQYLIEVNQYMNLTSIIDKDEVYRKHFLDSLEILRGINSNEFSLCDVVSGAGFPSIPLAIVNSKVKVTIIDALNKRIKFLNELITKLSLKNVDALHYRAEDYFKKVGPKYDIVTARAVARLNVLAELCMPLVKVGGRFIAMKGSTGQVELEEATKAIEILGGKVDRIITFELPEDLDKREIIIIKKIKETPSKYPRSFAKIKERPL